MNWRRVRATDQAVVDEWMAERRLGGDAHDVEAAVPSAWRTLQLRVGVCCTNPAHPRAVLSAATLNGLDRAEAGWRCPTCGRPDVWVFLRRSATGRDSLDTVS
jgi:hypothetical protein